MCKPLHYSVDYSINPSKDKTTLIKNADYVVTVNRKNEILKNASILIQGKQIKEVGTNKTKANEVINAKGMIVFPGFINTHLHIPQVFHRHCPTQQNKPIAQWIEVTTSINKELGEEEIYYGALICFGELMLSGSTTCLDYFYPFVKGKKGTIEATIKAARDIGLRFTSIRGSMSQSKKQGTLYDEEVVEDQQKILQYTKEVIEKFHDDKKYSMIRIGAGPCLPFSSTEEDFKQTAILARKYNGVILQTHVAESEWEVTYCNRKFGTSPIGLMKRTNFLGSDVGLTHCNIITNDEIKLLGKTRTNVIVTPICNTRDAADGNGIAPIDILRNHGANVSIGVDGPASNDSMNIQDEMRYLRVISKAKEGLFWHGNDRLIDQTQFSYRHPLETLAITNLGGAKTLNRNDIGSIEEGKAADIAIFNPDAEISHAGVLNKWAAIMSCQPIKPKYLFVNGKLIVEDGEIKTINAQKVNKAFRKLHKKAISRAQKNLKVNLIDY